MITINIPVEKEYFITPQQIYDIISAAIEDAYDNGFINKYVFYRAMFSHMYVTLNESDNALAADQHLEIHMSPLEYWYEHLEDISKMITDYKEDLEYLTEIAAQWIDEYIKYAYSTRGMLDNLSDLMKNMSQEVENNLLSVKAQEELKSAMEIANKWGMNRVDNTIEIDEKETKIIPMDSLIEA